MMFERRINTVIDWTHAHRRAWLLLLIAVVGLVGLAGTALPFAVNPRPYHENATVHIMNWVCMFMFLALGLNVMCGFTGLLHLGYGGFMCIGAFTAAILMARYNWPYWATLPLAALLPAVVAFFIGLPVLRLTGDYFSIVTFGFSELVVLTAKNLDWLTGGANGLTNIPEVKFFGREFNSLRGNDYFVMIFWFTLILVILVYRLKNSRLGRAWIAIREDELAGQCLGVNLFRYKMTAFMVSAAIAGIGGSLMAVSQSYVSFQTFGFGESSVLVLCAVVLGGMGSIRGAILGGAAVAGLQLYLQRLVNKPEMSWLPKDAQFIVFGLLLVVMMRYRPQGLVNIKTEKRHRTVGKDERGALYTLGGKQP